MQIILLGDVRALGKKGQIMSANDGCARNFILPKKLRVEADSKNLNDLKLKKANDDRIAAEQLAAAEELGTKLDDSSMTLAVKAGESGRAFGFVSSKEIAKTIRDQPGIGIDKRRIMLSNPVKSIGSLEVPVKLHKDVTVRPAIKVVGV